MNPALTSFCHECREPGSPDKSLKVCSSCKLAYYCVSLVFSGHSLVHFSMQKLFCKEQSGSPHNKPRSTAAIQSLRTASANAAMLAMVPTDARAPPRNPNQSVVTSIPASFLDDRLNAPGGVAECYFPGWMKEAIFAQPGFPHPVPSTDSPAHKLVDIPGTGIGMRATRPLAAGDIIYAERPLIVLPIKWYPSTPPPNGDRATYEEFLQHGWKERELLLKVLVALMKPERQAAYRALANSHKHDGCGPLAGVLRTNGFGIGRPDWREIIPDIESRGDHETTMSGVCEVLSRINHSCGPNATVSFHMPSFSFVLTAVRDIPADGEITVAYCDLEVPAMARQQTLASYGFICTCKACSSPVVSNARRAAIFATDPIPQEAVHKWLRDATLADDYVIKKSQEMMRLIEEEGLESEWCTRAHAGVIAMAYAALGQRQNYLEARKKALALSNAFRPLGGGRLVKLLPEVPERQEFWMKRLRAKTQ